jgi:hypothetical protein
LYKFEKLMRLLWLLNAQTNSLLEPKLLTVQALEKAQDFKTELKNLKLSDEEEIFVREELGKRTRLYERRNGKSRATGKRNI